ncbi:MAG: NADH-quinone oxidoreductase subunit N [Bacteroidales bacterium]|nr:NADH-quinone oxidoreductase subunit N [Lentimicrobiaceae bacterium]MDD5695463.1 NADH-quinone oxidoreductase subunit N [Bacteroidales bacterium]
MNLSDLLIMRHELLLTLLAVIILVLDLGVGPRCRNLILPVSIGLFFIILLAGFLPVGEGSLFGGMYHTDPLTVLMKNILNIGFFIVMLQSVTWLKKEENQQKMSEFYVLLLATLIGMNFMISSGDFLMFYLGLELATIPMAALAAYVHHQTRSAEAGIKLILISALSSGILLFGLSMIYGTTGSIFFNEVKVSFTGEPLQVLAFIFFFTGMGFKISLVPFHLWTADVYEGAPVNVTSYLSVISKGAAVFIFILVLYTVFTSIAYLWKDLVYFISIVTMTLGNLFALRQKNLKRFLAFSSIAQAGFILLGIIAGSQLGMTSVIYFILVYIFSNLGAFGVVATVYNQSGKENMDDYNGLYHTNPKLSLLMMLSLFSLAGIPPVAGFFGKFFLFTSAASAGYYWLVLIAVLNATISLYYYLLVVKAMFINKNETPIAHFKSDVSTRIGLLICTAGIVVLGFYNAVYELISRLSMGIN